MCMHSNKQKLDSFIDYITQMDEPELDRLQEAIDRRRGSFKKKKNNKEKQSTVLERREHRHGLLQLEGRAYKRKKDGELTERGRTGISTTERVAGSARSTSARPIARRPWWAKS